MHRLGVAVCLDSADYRRSIRSVSVQLAALRTVSLVSFRLPDWYSWNRGLTQRTHDGRLTLLPIGHPDRPRYQQAAYRVTPPLTPGEQYTAKFRLRNRPSTKRAQYQEFTTSLAIDWDSLEAVDLAVTTPADSEYRPSWSRDDLRSLADPDHPVDESPLPRIAATTDCLRFAVTIESPPAGYAYVLAIREPRAY
jgi:hypothetical protein